MYEEFYTLSQPPFRITPDPEFLYLSPSHKEALAAIVYGVDERKGFIVVLGEVGLGKTTIVRSYLAAYDPARLSPAYVFNANVTFKALLDAIYQELGIADKPDDVFGMVSRLHQWLIEEYRQGRNVVLVVDEAQNMPVETLENLRVLSNLETATNKLLQIVLVGQPEFDDKLQLPELRQLRQRVAVRCTLLPFTRAESRAYVEYRLERAGASTSAVFTRWALRRIVRQARGIPRMLNILCDNALITGLGYQKAPVTAAIVREVIGDLEGRARGGHRRGWAWASLAALLVVGGALLAASYGVGFQPTPAAAVVVPAPPPSPPRLAIEPPRSPSPSPLPDEGASLGAERLPSVGAAAQQPAEPPIVATKVVQEGDGLYRLALAVYGFVNDEVLRRIVERNPEITDVDRILVGSSIRFPDVSDLRARTPGPTSRAQ
jgi:general secretion pathway protein A